MPKQSNSPSPAKRPIPRPPQPASPAAPLEVVDPAWMLKALTACVLAAFLFGYLAVCFLLYQGSWQLLLHPTRTPGRTPAAAQIPFDALRFDAAETGVPRLAAWWIPTTRPNAPTILFLHDGRGNLADNVDLLAALHQANVNLFAIDYRGFGQSDPAHPTELRMNQDAAAALDYLVNTRHIPAATIIPYGLGLGASLAATLAGEHSELPAVILDNPDPNAGQRILEAERSRFIPVSLLVRDRFDLTPVVTAIKQPKLLISGGPEDPDPSHDREAAALFAASPNPKLTITLLPPSNPHFNPSRSQFDYVQAITRFLDEYLVADWNAPGASPQPVTPHVTPAGAVAPR